MPLQATSDQVMYGYWTVVSVIDGGKRTMARCICVCGAQKLVQMSKLKHGQSQSCGCQRKPTFDGMIGAIRYSYQRNARRMNRDFSLSIEECVKLFTSPCEYCGHPPSRKAPGRWRMFLYTGIDRADQSSGYVTDNAVPCCTTCNFAKRTMTTDEFLSWADRVHRHSVSTGRSSCHCMST